MLRLKASSSKAPPPAEEVYTVQSGEPTAEDLEQELFSDVTEQFLVNKEHVQSNDTSLFVIDRGEKRPAWQDEDEDNALVELARGNRNKKLRGEGELTGGQLEDKLRTQFVKLHGTPKWADKTTRKPQSALLSSTAKLTAPSTSLPTKKLHISRCKNLNARKRSKVVIQSAEFHPSAAVGFVAGYNKTVDIFEVDGENNKHLHSAHIANYPIDCAKFTSDGQEIILGSRRPFFYTYDLQKCVATQIAGIRNKPEIHYKNFNLSENGEFIGFEGQDGLLAIFSAKDKQMVKCIKHRKKIRCSQWLDEHHVVTAGDGGFCTLWDTRTWGTVSEFQDEGALQITSLALSHSNLAVGSASGVVNLYNKSAIYQPQATPLRSVMNLTTEIDTLKFNSTGELLAMSTKLVNHGMRLVNMQTLYVTPNFPKSDTPLGHVTALNFSPNSGYLTVGNVKGGALLYRLNHYKSF